MRIFYSLLALCLSISAAPLTTYTLDNGLKVILKQDRRAPMVLTQMWYHVGGADERDGKTGLSHILEHCLFFATKHLPHDTMKTFVAERGGMENAFTTQDATAYYTWLPKAYLNDALFLEAERMRYARFPKALFDNEMRVIAEERRMRVDNQPEAKAMEYFNSLAHVRSPYHAPVIGWASDIQHTRQDAIDWYQTWYAPNNAVLVVLGDFELESAKKTIAHFSTPLREKALPARAVRPALPPMGTRTLGLSTPTQTPYMIYGFNVPTVKTMPNDWRPYALRVAAAILSEGHSSRLDQRLLYKTPMVSSVGIYYPMHQQHQTTLSIHLSPISQTTTIDLVHALEQSLHDLGHQPIRAAELKRAKAQIIAAHTFAQDAMHREAAELGKRAIVGIPLREKADFIDRIQAVQAQQVQTVVNTYLQNPNRTIVDFIPKGEH